MNSVHGHQFCPGCGHDLVKDQPIIIGEWSTFGSGYPLSYLGHPLKLPQAQVDLCLTLMKSYPRPVRTDVILNRLGSDAGPNCIAVHVSRIKTTLRALGIPCPIANVHGQGYVWQHTTGRDA